MVRTADQERVEDNRLNESKLAKIIHRVAKMLVSLLEEEYGLGKKDKQTT